MAPKRIDNPTLNEIASGVGYLCFMYNGLESRVTTLIGLLAGLKDDDLEILATPVDLKKKLPMLKAFAFKNKPSALWLEDIELMIWAVNHHIIPLRNRYVHDVWLSLPSGPMRRYERTRVSKSQSRKEPELTTYEYISTSADDVWALVQDTRDVSNIIRLLHRAYRAGTAATHPEQSFPQQYRDQWLARRNSQKGSNAEG